MFCLLYWARLSIHIHVVWPNSILSTTQHNFPILLTPNAASLFHPDNPKFDNGLIHVQRRTSLFHIFSSFRPNYNLSYWLLPGYVYWFDNWIRPFCRLWVYRMQIKTPNTIIVHKPGNHFSYFIQILCFAVYAKGIRLLQVLTSIWEVLNVFEQGIHTLKPLLLN